MPDTTSRRPAGAKRRRHAKQLARSEGRVKAEAALRAVARSASLDAVLDPRDPLNKLDSKHSRFVVKLISHRADARKVARVAHSFAPR